MRRVAVVLAAADVVVSAECVGARAGEDGEAGRAGNVAFHEERASCSAKRDGVVEDVAAENGLVACGAEQDGAVERDEGCAPVVCGGTGRERSYVGDLERSARHPPLARLRVDAVELRATGRHRDSASRRIKDCGISGYWVSSAAPVRYVVPCVRARGVGRAASRPGVRGTMQRQGGT